MKSNYSTGYAVLHHAPRCKLFFVYSHGTETALPELFTSQEEATLEHVTKVSCECGGKELPVTCYSPVIDTQWWAFICPVCGVITKNLGPFYAMVVRSGAPSAGEEELRHGQEVKA